MRKLTFMLIVVWFPVLAYSEAFSTSVPMHSKGAMTYYVGGFIEGVGRTEFMVDTGSGYSAINEETLAVLEEQGLAHFIKDLNGVLADGQQIVVPIYLISSISIGNACSIKDIEVAIFPGKTRAILGISTLQRTAPFQFSMVPPELLLSNCVPPKLADAY